MWTSIKDQSGLVDLTTASPALMITLMEGLGTERNARRGNDRINAKS